MNITAKVVATGVVVVAGRFAEGKPPGVRVAVGMAGLGLGLSMLPEEIAGPMATLVLVFALFTYVPELAKGAGVAK